MIRSPMAITGAVERDIRVGTRSVCFVALPLGKLNQSRVESAVNQGKHDLGGFVLEINENRLY
jgi:hypothetical protein